MFLRFHNLVARTLKQEFANMDDETLYQWARKITTSVYQNALNDYLGAYIGIPYNKRLMNTFF